MSDTSASGPAGVIRIWRLRSNKRDTRAAWRVMIDGRQYGRVKNGQKAEFRVVPGSHQLKLKTAPWCSSPAQSIYVGPGQSAEFSAKPGGGILDAYFSLWLRPGKYIVLDPIADFQSQFGDQVTWPEDVAARAHPRSSSSAASTSPGMVSSPARNRGSWLRSRFLLTIVLLVVVVVLGVVLRARNPNPNPEPAPAGPRGSAPSSLRGVLDPVVLAGLQSCAQAALINPANCPQNEQPLGLTGIEWTLHGDPLDGAQYFKQKQGSQAVVEGHAIMTLQYSSYGSPGFEVKDVPYYAVINWNDGHPTLDHIEPLYESGSCDRANCAPTGLITKAPDPSSSSQIDAVLGAKFQSCLATRSLVQPPECPVQDRTVSPSMNVTWRLTSDPLLNSRITFDGSYGVIHVVGSFVMHATFTSYGSPSTDDKSGRYDAEIVDDGGTLVVLQILAT